MGILIFSGFLLKDKLSPTHKRRRGPVQSLICAVAAYACAWTSPAYAQDFAPLNNMLENVSDALTGPTGRAAGLVAIAVVGILFMMGRMHWQFAFSVLAGLVVLFGAQTILDGIGAGN